jgi:hypothetical protein
MSGLASSCSALSGRGGWLTRAEAQLDLNSKGNGNGEKQMQR